MGKVLAKKPSKRVRANNSHPTFVKLEKLFNYMKKLNLYLGFYKGRIFVSDTRRGQDTEWEIINVKDQSFVRLLPCNTEDYKICQDKELPPHEAQIAPPELLKIELK